MFEQRVGRISPVSGIDCKSHGTVKRVAAWNLHDYVTVTLCPGVTRLADPTPPTHTHTCLNLQHAHPSLVALRHNFAVAVINGTLIGEEL
jgi:hypothetical protein